MLWKRYGTKKLLRAFLSVETCYNSNVILGRSETKVVYVTRSSDL